MSDEGEEEDVEADWGDGDVCRGCGSRGKCRPNCPDVGRDAAESAAKIACMEAIALSARHLTLGLLGLVTATTCPCRVGQPCAGCQDLRRTAILALGNLGRSTRSP